MKCAWIAKHQAHWLITLTCEVPGVNPSSYFERWRRKDKDKSSSPGVSKRLSDEALLAPIKAIYAEVGVA